VNVRRLLPLIAAALLAGAVYAIAMPFVAITTVYAYVDARARGELEAEQERGELAPEIELRPEGA
jgi:hypothetical protein